MATFEGAEAEFSFGTGPDEAFEGTACPVATFNGAEAALNERRA